MAPSGFPSNGAQYPDTEMKDSIQPEQTFAPLAPARTMAPPAATTTRPTQANPHGAQARIYLNKNVTPHLLEGVKYLSIERPEQPLKWLAEFLARKSEEIERTGGAS